MSRRERRHRRQGRWQPRRTAPRRLGLELSILWAATLCAWAYTGWVVYTIRVRHQHSDASANILIVDLAMPLLACWMSVEWWRARRK